MDDEEEETITVDIGEENFKDEEGVDFNYSSAESSSNTTSPETKRRYTFYDNTSIHFEVRIDCLKPYDKYSSTFLFYTEHNRPKFYNSYHRIQYD
jgi:hypothetical protein